MTAFKPKSPPKTLIQRSLVGDQEAFGEIFHPAKNVLLDYLSAEVSPSQKKLLQGHLAGCERC